MQAGKLNERITLQRCEVLKDAGGGQARQWADVAKDLPASRRDMGGSEKPATGAAGGEVALTRAEFTIRWMPGVDATMRVLHGDEKFAVLHVNNFAGKRESLVLTCETGVRDG